MYCKIYQSCWLFAGVHEIRLNLWILSLNLGWHYLLSVTVLSVNESMWVHGFYTPSKKFSWWHHQTKTFSALLVPCAGNSPVTGEFSAQGAVTRSFDIFFYLRPNKQLSKQSWGWWFETPSCSLWRDCKVRSVMVLTLAAVIARVFF